MYIYIYTYVYMYRYALVAVADAQDVKVFFDHRYKSISMLCCLGRRGACVVATWLATPCANTSAFLEHLATHI